MMRATLEITFSACILTSGNRKGGVGSASSTRECEVRALVTGVAGFIGSSLADRLIAEGHEVVGIDCLNGYYDPALKMSNLDGLTASDNFSFHKVDLRDADLPALLDGVDVVFHQAGQPGVRSSWEEFPSYVQNNVVATEHLVRAALDAGVSRLVYASSSSVYGDAATFPTSESVIPSPRSPYGVTKLAGEHVCSVFARNFGLPVVSLRYFTVFGPRQRPDMAMHRLVEAALGGTPFPMFGDGSQVRDFTYVSDVVEANMLAAQAPDVTPGSVYNVAGGGAHSLAEVIASIEEVVGRPIPLERKGARAGDVEKTGGLTEKAATELRWAAKVPLLEGLRSQVDWHIERRH